MRKSICKRCLAVSLKPRQCEVNGASVVMNLHQYTGMLAHLDHLAADLIDLKLFVVRAKKLTLTTFAMVPAISGVQVFKALLLGWHSIEHCFGSSVCELFYDLHDAQRLSYVVTQDIRIKL